MKLKSHNFAYIDGANLHHGVKALGWRLDYKRFRVWLSEKYGVDKAYIFIGLIPKNQGLYKYLQEAGFILVFKEVIYDSDGKAKGNCDADLVLQVVCDAYENNYSKAVIISSDGDYSGLVKFLKDRGQIEAILSPHDKKLCSILLKRTSVPIAYISDQRSVLGV